jgi:hypothetical protein
LLPVGLRMMKLYVSGRMIDSMLCCDSSVFQADGRAYPSTIDLLDPGTPWAPRTEYWSMHPIRPSQTAGFLYGASLTPIEVPQSDDSTYCAIRFGGFRGGGYSHETNQVALLTVQHVLGQQPTVRWEEIQTNNSHLATPRAYHTATLLNGRYLVIVGGMMWRESILDLCILDTQTWTWLDQLTTGSTSPSGRHGHSMVLDSIRNRLVLFGGGNGTGTQGKQRLAELA